MNKYFADGYLFCAPAGATRFVSVMKQKVITTYILKFRMLRRYRKIEDNTLSAVLQLLPLLLEILII